MNASIGTNDCHTHDTSHPKKTVKAKALGRKCNDKQQEVDYLFTKIMRKTLDAFCELNRFHNAHHDHFTQTNSMKRNHQMIFFAQAVVGHILLVSTNLDVIWNPFERNEFHTALWEMPLQKKPMHIQSVKSRA